ncbi:MAG: DNA mismatch endonuclease Vsr [Planctomycetota bacterium]|nr:DNA mismatch endonuclease Vsr [Planctomycetaceae bacterium]MDQ3331928.1 DNA mismatch endonuclease Vsr [Planctomycetota bacterium]
MRDCFDKATRSRIMAAVRGKHTAPEMVVRRLAHGLGFRFRLHRAMLPGRPDLVFASRRKVIFVHGCFWHRRECPRGRSTPAANRRFWREKFTRNVARDQRNMGRLRRLGWGVMVVWECQTAPAVRDRLAGRLKRFLASAEA